MKGGDCMYYIYALYESDAGIENDCVYTVDSWKKAIKRIAELYKGDKENGCLGDYYYYASSYESLFYTYF